MMREISCRRLRCALALWIPLVAARAVAEDPEQQLKEQTVMITVTLRDRSVEHGSGVVLCQVDDRAYVLTAHHVLAGRLAGDKQILRRPSRTEIHFFHASPPTVVDDRATGSRVLLFHQVPKEDLLLLSFPLLPRLPVTASLAAPSPDVAGGEDDEPPAVFAVGYRKASMESWAAERGVLLPRAGKFLHHSAQVVEGFSGGPLFNEAGALIGINVERVAGEAIEAEAGRFYGEALAIEEILPAIDKWVPASCLRSASLLADLAHLTYRKAMRAVSIHDWESAEKLMAQAVRQQPLEGGSVHLQGMRYTTYLPHFHLGLAYYKLGRFSDAIREWERSESQGVIQQDKRYRSLKRNRERCYEALRSRRTEVAPSGPWF